MCESEVKGMDEGSKMVEGLRLLFRALGATEVEKATSVLFADNQGGIAWANSEAITKKMQHVDIREMAVRDAIKFNDIVLAHIPGTLNPADLFTKEMKDTSHFLVLRSCLMSPWCAPAA